MAAFDFSGIDELMLSLEELADLPDEVLEQMLRAQGEVVQSAQRGQLRAFSGTGQLAGSIAVTDKLRRDRSGTPCLYVYPAGTRSDGKTRNAEVGFILEYGAPKKGIRPRQWMRLANEKAASAAAQAAGEVYNAYLREKGL